MVHRGYNPEELMGLITLGVIVVFMLMSYMSDGMTNTKTKR